MQLFTLKPKEYWTLLDLEDRIHADLGNEILHINVDMIDVIRDLPGDESVLCINSGMGFKLTRSALERLLKFLESK